MIKSLLAFVISLSIVILICTVVAVVRQHKINKREYSVTLPINDNIMDTSKYSGHYGTCNTGIVDKEF